MSQTGDDRLEAERAKTAAETAKLGAETLKLNAEKLKVDAEAAKITADKEKIVSDSNPTSAKSERGVAELEKVKAETAKLVKESKAGKGLLAAEWIKAIGAVGLAAGALYTAHVAFSNYRVTTSNADFDHALRHRAEAAELAKGFSADSQPGARMAAAVGLRAFLSDDDVKLRSLAVDALTYGMVLETDRDVQQVIEDGLVSAGAAADAPLSRMVKLADSDVRLALNRNKDDKCPPRGGGSADDKLAIQRQSSMVDGVLALSRIRGGPPNFSGLTLKCFELYTATDGLKDANFTGTNLWQSDLYATDLENADFTQASAQDGLFNHSTLTGAIFTGADLKNANFSKVTGLTAEQLRKARSLECAKLDVPLATELASEIQPAVGQACHP